MVGMKCLFDCMDALYRNSDLDPSVIVSNIHVYKERSLPSEFELVKEFDNVKHEFKRRHKG